MSSIRSRPGLAAWERDCIAEGRLRQAAIARLAEERWGYFLTLTWARKMFDRGRAERLVVFFVRRFFKGRRWLWVIERHRDGSLHAHILVHVDAPLRAVERACRWWGCDNRAGRLRGAQFVAALRHGIADLRIVERRQADWDRTVGYVTKYCFKQFASTQWGCNLAPGVVHSNSSAHADWLPARTAGGFQGAPAQAIGQDAGSGARSSRYLDRGTARAEGGCYEHL